MTMKTNEPLKTKDPEVPRSRFGQPSMHQGPKPESAMHDPLAAQGKRMRYVASGCGVLRPAEDTLTPICRAAATDMGRYRAEP